MGEVPNEQDTRPNEERLRLGFGEIVPAVTWATGLFVALLWLAGRTYASGYYGAMNIPADQLNFTVEEYAEKAWLPVILYASVMTLGASFLGLVLQVMWGGLKLLLGNFINSKAGQSKILEWVRERFGEIYHLFQQIGRKAPMLRYWWGIFLFSVFGVCIALSLLFALDYVGSQGDKTGKNIVLRNDLQIELVSIIPLDLEAATTASHLVEGNTSPFVYQGYRLLTHNSGKYYFFNELDPVTCKPKQVYIVDERQLVQVNEFPASPLDSRCAGAPAQPATPQPQSTPTPTAAVP